MPPDDEDGTHASLLPFCGPAGVVRTLSVVCFIPSPLLVSSFGRSWFPTLNALCRRGSPATKESLVLRQAIILGIFFLSTRPFTPLRRKPCEEST
ncbi:hypothetical protein DM02DRAFT_93531 [Periconia macrospinosa]|uniref:Uncharacterized protein n=1 Tax=Periconia macrospinosa TaxID=97972 RepID=A0A2V1DG44_9PLEO|nr:hypothetical protein DM02DRAFT_93531 [Periconia macrospinosa]